MYEGTSTEALEFAEAMFVEMERKLKEELRRRKIIQDQEDRRRAGERVNIHSFKRVVKTTYEETFVVFGD